MAVTVDSLVAPARLESGLRDNAYYSADQIIGYLSNGGAELYDIFTQANQHYVVSSYDFTTTGPASAVVSLPPRFQQGHSLEIYPDQPGQTRTIRFLANWLNRNAYAGGAFPLMPGGFDPVYTFLDQKLRFYPPQCVPAAPFRLYYTPLWTPLAALVTRTFAANSFDTPGTAGPSSAPSWLIAGANFTAADIGGTIRPTLNAPNTAWNINFTITDVFSATAAACTPSPTGVGSYTLPSVGTFAITASPAGTTNVIPTVMEPWAEYLVVYAAIAINTDRQRGTGELERKLAAMKQRIASVISVRQEEPQQPPLTRGDGWGGGWGWP